MCSSGTESRRASATPVNDQVNPGPEMVMRMPGSPVTRAQPPAMNAALSSLVATTVRRPACRSASKSSSVCVPGKPKTQRTPDCWSASTIRAPPVCHLTWVQRSARSDDMSVATVAEIVLGSVTLSTRIGFVREVREQGGLPRKWSVQGSNLRPPGCKPGALPAELTPLTQRNIDASAPTRQQNV